jgi:hypothetical protein
MDPSSSRRYFVRLGSVRVVNAFSDACKPGPLDAAALEPPATQQLRRPVPITTTGSGMGGVPTMKRSTSPTRSPQPIPRSPQQMDATNRRHSPPSSPSVHATQTREAPPAISLGAPTLAPPGGSGLVASSTSSAASGVAAGPSAYGYLHAHSHAHPIECRGCEGSEPKYVRVLFPAPFETGYDTPPSSQLVVMAGGRTPIAGAPSAPPSNMPPGQSSLPVAQPVYSGGVPTGAQQQSASSNEAAPWEQQAPMLRRVSSVNTSGGASSAPLQNESEFSCVCSTPRPYLHFLMKIHGMDDSSGQCSVRLDARHFRNGSRLDFCQPLSRHGMPLRDAITGKPLHARFALELRSVA